MCIGINKCQYSQAALKQYSRNELCDIREAGQNKKHMFENETFSNIHSLGLGKRRGKRVGKNLLVKQNINVISNQVYTNKHGYGVNAKNLIEIKCKDQEKNNSDRLAFGLVNSRSIGNKVDILSDNIISENLDILAICETWLHSENGCLLDQICPSDFTAIHLDRQNKRGGVVAILCRSTLQPKQQDSLAHSSFEHVLVSVQPKQTKLTITVIYKPPCSNLSLFLKNSTRF